MPSALTTRGTKNTPLLSFIFTHLSNVETFRYMGVTGEIDEYCSWKMQPSRKKQQIASRDGFRLVVSAPKRRSSIESPNIYWLIEFSVLSFFSLRLQRSLSRYAFKCWYQPARSEDLTPAARSTPLKFWCTTCLRPFVVGGTKMNTRR